MESAFTKKTLREHILLRPDVYVGSVRPSSRVMMVPADGGGFEEREVTFVPALLKVFDEVLVNASDRRVAHLENPEIRHQCKNVRVEVSDGGTISVENDGHGIPVTVHQGEDKVLLPELVFGHLLTGNKFDDAAERLSGGRNGYGAKLTNIFSHEFSVETVDPDRKKRFRQTFSDHMLSRSEPVVEAYSGKPYTRVTFRPDLALFGGEEAFSEDLRRVLHRRVVDAAASCPTGKSKVFWNGELVPFSSVDKLAVSMFPGFSAKATEKQPRWDVTVLYFPGKGYSQVSYVNGIPTYQGGTHVDHVVDQVARRVLAEVGRKVATKVLAKQVREHLKVFVSCQVVNPAFTSQMKECLSTPPSLFGSSCRLSEGFLSKLARSGIVAALVQAADKREEESLRRSDGRKVERIRGVEKLEDAEWAGTRRSAECGLIVTEGDSAKALAMRGLVLVGKKRFGVFPIKGKLLNVREASPRQVLENDEVSKLKKILGLQQGRKYATEEDRRTLRYGFLVIFTDQDTDGSHIKGLLINFLHTFWPELLETSSFVRTLTTPIVKAFPARAGAAVLEFYNLSDYERWRDTSGVAARYRVKYYKGLGTSRPEEAKDYFRDIDQKLITYRWDSLTDESMSVAFCRRRTGDRKERLVRYDRSAVLDNSQKEVGFTEFVEKDLVHFWKDDTERSVPSLVDGLKPSQRKVLFGAFRKRLDRDEVKVAQLAGYVSDVACYHHGEASLTATIVNMAQDFLGSNNVNLLLPNGQFGTRLLGGQDAGAPRYIWTRLHPVTPFLFRKEDWPVLQMRDDDGVEVEPVYFLPVLCLALVNGFTGIGTGFSTFLPPYRPSAVAANVRRLLAGQEPEPMVPYFRGFRGTVRHESEEKVVVEGAWQPTGPSSVRVTELPVGSWTTPYKKFLEELVDEGVVESFADSSTDVDVRFDVKFPPAGPPEDVGAKLRLRKVLSLANVHLFTTSQTIRRFRGPLEILRCYFEERLLGYRKRKESMVESLRAALTLLQEKVRFMEKKLDGTLRLEDKTSAELQAELDRAGFLRVDGSFDYLTGMPLLQLTTDRHARLVAEREAAREKLEACLATSVEDMWRADLDELEEQLKKHELF